MQKRFLFLVVFLLAALIHAVDVPQYEVFEHSVTHPSGEYDNVWAVEMPVTLTSPSGNQVQIGGFFYEENTWMFRFAPQEVGEWTFTATVDGTTEQNGTFTCTASDNPGYLRENPHNPRRWVMDNGEPFYLFGLQDCLEHGKYDHNEIDKNNWGVNSRKGLSFREYLDVHKSAGFNLWRLNFNNCDKDLLGARIDKRLYPYSEKNGKIFDKYAKILKEKGFKIFCAIFGMGFPFSKNEEDMTEENMNRIRHFFTYAMNRYGAYVDIWELGNEVRANSYPDTMLTIMTEHLKAIDPYPPTYVSMSWERPEIEELDVISPHSYTRSKPPKFDEQIRNTYEEYAQYNKPVMIGELGNGGTCPYDTIHDYPDARHEDRWRVSMWTMFFSEISPVFWHTENRNWCGNGPKNFHLDSASLKYFNILAQWRDGFDPTAKTVHDLVETTNQGVRGYALSGNNTYAVYLYDWQGYASTRTGLSITINPAIKGTGAWMDPKTGETLGAVNIEQAGEQTIEVPDFKADAVLKVSLEGVSGVNLPQSNRKKPRLVPNNGAPVYSVPGRRIPGNTEVAPGVYFPKAD